MKDQTTVLLIGLGGLGEVALNYLAREEEIGRIVVGSRNEKRGEERCNLVRMGATAQGYHPEIEFVPLNLTHVMQQQILFTGSHQVLSSTLPV